MQDQTVRIVSQAIRYIEHNLNNKLELDKVAAALHYSQFHLHRIFTKTVGLTVHEYIQRRQLTEAAKLLAFSQKPILEIALVSGYESQQAFTDVFKAMYKSVKGTDTVDAPKDFIERSITSKTVRIFKPSISDGDKIGRTLLVICRNPLSSPTASTFMLCSVSTLLSIFFTKSL